MLVVAVAVVILRHTRANKASHIKPQVLESSTWFPVSIEGDTMVLFLYSRLALGGDKGYYWTGERQEELQHICPS